MDETKNPWSVLSRATVYQNDWIRVVHHEVLRPSGGPACAGRFISRTKPRASSRSTKMAMLFWWGSTGFRFAPTVGKFPRVAGRIRSRLSNPRSGDSARNAVLPPGAGPKFWAWTFPTACQTNAARRSSRGNFPKRPRSRMKPKSCRLRACPSGMVSIASSKERSARRSASRPSFALLSWHCRENCRNKLQERLAAKGGIKPRTLFGPNWQVAEGLTFCEFVPGMEDFLFGCRGRVWFGAVFSSVPDPFPRRSKPP